MSPSNTQCRQFIAENRYDYPHVWWGFHFICVMRVNGNPSNIQYFEGYASSLILDSPIWAISVHFDHKLSLCHLFELNAINYQ